jgi:hypothetical protein
LQKEIVVTKNLSSLVAGLIALLVASSPALALGSASWTFVSASPQGVDTGTCPITAPCRTFAYALTQTAQNGEIIVLTSGGYGAVTIGQAVSIINTSNFAGVTVASGDGITINAGTNDSVTLRGLTIDGGGAGSNGVVLNSGLALTIDQCNLMNFVGNGILLQSTSGGHNIVITNTSASHNQAAGVTYSPLSGTATAGIVIDHVTANNNGTGILFDSNSGATSASVSNSIGSDNSACGFIFGHATVSLDSSYASGNQTCGVFINNGTLALGRSVIMTNGIGVDFGMAGTVISYKNNQIAGNGSDVFGGALTPVNPQ